MHRYVQQARIIDYVREICCHYRIYSGQLPLVGRGRLHHEDSPKQAMRGAVDGVVLLRRFIIHGYGLWVVEGVASPPAMPDFLQITCDCAPALMGTRGNGTAGACLLQPRARCGQLQGPMAAALTRTKILRIACTTTMHKKQDQTSEEVVLHSGKAGARVGHSFVCLSGDKFFGGF